MNQLRGTHFLGAMEQLVGSGGNRSQRQAPRKREAAAVDPAVARDGGEEDAGPAHKQPRSLCQSAIGTNARSAGARASASISASGAGARSAGARTLASAGGADARSAGRRRIGRCRTLLQGWRSSGKEIARSGWSRRTACTLADGAHMPITHGGRHLSIDTMPHGAS